jgi:L,D-peptidoglycan transpeptidase YkuD (ErfK/YbiS/YcfS/YnhG family)
MIKSFLISISFSTLLFSAQQIILVVAEDFNTSQAKLSCFEGKKKICNSIDVNLGKNGLGWGIGVKAIAHNSHEPIKHEGDKRAPAGIFRLTDTFGYSPKPLSHKMPHLYADEKLICVDASDSPFYNQLIESNGDEKSFESMRREDIQYKMGIYVAHNPHAVSKRGSCIFIHIQKTKNHPTLGCTSMAEEDLEKIISWLDRSKKPLLIVIPKKYLPKIYEIYPQLKE